MSPTATTDTLGSEIRSETDITRLEVKQAIFDEAMAKGRPCSRKQAKKLIDMLARAIKEIRELGYDKHYILSPAELELHSLYETIMPGDQLESRPGSAKLAIERLLLDPARGELAFVHSSTGDDYCTVFAATVHHSV